MRDINLLYLFIGTTGISLYSLLITDYSSLQAEALVALFILEKAAEMGIQDLILETDATELKMALSTTLWIGAWMRELV